MKTIVIRYPLERDIKITRPDTYGLEDAFNEFNAGSFQECEEFLSAHVRSLSVGDLVWIDRAWHLCKSVGWEVMGDLAVAEYLKAIEVKLDELRKVEDDPNLSAWFAVNDVMWTMRRAELTEQK